MIVQDQIGRNIENEFFRVTDLAKPRHRLLPPPPSPEPAAPTMEGGDVVRRYSSLYVLVVADRE